MTSREHTVGNAYGKTFSWILDADGNAVRPWYNFVRWLCEEDDVYWISGKAGSGMFLCRHLNPFAKSLYTFQETQRQQTRSYGPTLISSIVYTRNSTTN